MRLKLLYTQKKIFFSIQFFICQKSEGKNSLASRVASFAKFREMQKMILQKMFRQKWVRNFAKMITADFGQFLFQF